jgi:hypothetical protein
MVTEILFDNDLSKILTGLITNDIKAQPEC